ncbi:MAG: hypothetical protein KBB39_02925 [Phycicoccus sp.]|nr:hypothetical protein [Phycicoccus sp.]
MTLGGDPRDLRDLARGLRRAADEIDDVQRRVALAQGVLWRGPAADRFLAEVRGHGPRIERSSEATRAAAASLEALAIALEVRQAAIQAAMAAVESQLAQARHTIASGAAQAQDTVTDLERTLIDRAKQALERVGPLPLPGHPDWLLLADRLAA